MRFRCLAPFSWSNRCLSLLSVTPHTSHWITLVTTVADLLFRVPKDSDSSCLRSRCSWPRARSTSASTGPHLAPRASSSRTSAMRPALAASDNKVSPVGRKDLILEGNDDKYKTHHRNRARERKRKRESEKEKARKRKRERKREKERERERQS